MHLSAGWLAANQLAEPAAAGAVSYAALHLVPFANYTHHKTFYIHIYSPFTPTVNEHGTQHCSLNSPPHTHVKDSQYLPCSTAINITYTYWHFNMPWYRPALLMHPTASFLFYIRLQLFSFRKHFFCYLIRVGVAQPRSATCDHCMHLTGFQANLKLLFHTPFT